MTLCIAKSHKLHLIEIIILALQIDIDNLTLLLQECLDMSTNISWSRDWLLWKQTTMLCSLTFTLLLGTLTQIKQILTVGNGHRHYGLLLCIMLCSLLLQCSVVFLLLIITNKETNWLPDFYKGSYTTRRIITIAMALVFVIALLEICEFVLMN